MKPQPRVEDAEQGPVVDHLKRALRGVVKDLQREADRIESRGGLHRIGKRGNSIRVPVSFSVFVHYGEPGEASKRLDVKAKANCPHAWEPGAEACLGCGLSVKAIKAALPAKGSWTA